jgi:hypothetical protein
MDTMEPGPLLHNTPEPPLPTAQSLADIPASASAQETEADDSLIVAASRLPPSGSTSSDPAPPGTAAPHPAAPNNCRSAPVRRGSAATAAAAPTEAAASAKESAPTMPFEPVTKRKSVAVAASASPPAWRDGTFAYAAAEGCGHGRALAGVFVARDRVLSAGFDCLAREWRADTGALIRSVAWHTGPVRAVVGDDGVSVSGGEDGCLMVRPGPRALHRATRAFLPSCPWAGLQPPCACACLSLPLTHL